MWQYWPKMAKVFEQSGKYLQYAKKAAALEQAGKVRAAEHFYQLALRENPNSVGVLNRLALIACSVKNYTLAVEFWRRAVRIKSNDVELRSNLANALLFVKRPDEALDQLVGIDIEQAPVEVCLTIAKAHREKGQGNSAISTLKEILRRESSATVHLEFANLLSERGDFIEAEAHYKNVLEIEPTNPRALLGFAVAHQFVESDIEIARIEAIINSPNTSIPLAVHHAAGKMYHDLGRSDEAFAQFLKSKAKSPVFPIERYKNFVDRMIELFPAVKFQTLRSLGHSSEKLVFIVGMPRSGTSLVDQICASHPDVVSIGEQTLFGDVMQNVLGVSMRAVSFGHRLASLDRATIHQIADQYLKACDKIDNRDCRRIVNKLPHNFEFLGMIATVFPGAQIIHCNRDPLNTCLSCFMQPFSDLHAYNRNLGTLGRFYGEYRRLMGHWRSSLPTRMIEVHYEEIVCDLSQQVRRITEFLDLPWDDRCLDFYSTRRDVRTPSRRQVRQPIYTSSLDVAMRYKEHLVELVEALGHESTLIPNVLLGLRESGNALNRTSRRSRPMLRTLIRPLSSVLSP